MRALANGYPRSHRAGFTLIEILVVMVVVLILVGMVLGAILVVNRQVGRVQQFSEISELEIALNDFKSKHGVFPPSRIRLREWNPATSQVSDAYSMDDPFDAHSVGYLKRIWPDIRLPIRQSVVSPVLSEIPDAGEIIQWFVPDPTGWSPQLYELEGDECLVFFLGGIAEKLTDTSYVLHGFTADPKNPSRIPNTQFPRTIERIAGTFQFRPGRLFQREFPASVALMGEAEHDPAGSTARIDFFPTGYSGSQRPIKLPSYRAASSDAANPRPIVYFSSYEGRGYRPDDVNIPPLAGPDDPTQIAEQTILFQLRWPRLTYPSDSPSTTPPLPASPYSLGPNPYTQTSLAASATGTGVKPIEAFNPKTFQIILPGPDGEYGAGGHLDDYTAGASWQHNKDNLANFTGGSTIDAFFKEQK